MTRGKCKRCELYRTCKGKVAGIGARRKLMLVGEAPGEEEDIEGEPFVGRSGEILMEMIRAMHLRPRKDMFITNVVKCRPPDNRKPHKDETLACLRHLRREIKRVKPKCIVTLGNVPTQALLKDPSLRITRIHGKQYKYKGIPLVPVFHPSYLLRQGKSDLAEETIADLLKAWALVQGCDKPTIKGRDQIKIVRYKPHMAPLKSRYIGFDLEWHHGDNPWAEDAAIHCGSLSAGNTCVFFYPKDMKYYLSYMLSCRGIFTGHAIHNDLLQILVLLCKNETQIKAVLSQKYCCSLILTHLYDHRIEPKALKHLSEVKAGVKLMDHPWQRGQDVRSVPWAKMKPYNCLDSWGGVQLAKWFTSRLDEQRLRLAELLCFHVLPATVASSYFGMKVSRKQLGIASSMYEKREKKQTKKLLRLAPDLNFKSTDAILNHVFGTLGLPVMGYQEKQEWGKAPDWASGDTWDSENNRPVWAVKQRKPKWDKIVKLTLRKLDKSGFVKAIIRRDRAHKFRVTYLVNFRDRIRSDGCIHPRFILTKQAEAGAMEKYDKGGTKTGRPVMVQPGFQTIPKGDKGQPVRSVIVSRYRNGWILCWDYKQIELYVAADLASCERMIEIFTEGKLDYHTWVASELFRVKYRNVTDDMRDRGKTVNFAIIYGCQPPKLVKIFKQHGLTLGRGDARLFHRRWYGLHPEILAWQENTIEFTIRHGHMIAPSGQREYIYASRIGRDGQKGCRQAINFGIQNGAAVIANAGYAACQEAFLRHPFYGRSILMGHVYDAIVQDVQDRYVKKVVPMTEHLLTDAESLVGPLGWHLQVPLRVELKKARCLT